MERKGWQIHYRVRFPILTYVGLPLVVVALAISSFLFPFTSSPPALPSPRPLPSNGAWNGTSPHTLSRSTPGDLQVQPASLEQPAVTALATPIADPSIVDSLSIPSMLMLRASERSANPSPSLLLIACGDLMLRSVPSGALDEVQPLFQEADYRVGNLECALSQRGTPAPQKPYTFRDPGGLAFLQKAEIDLISLANNHSWDYQWEGLQDSFQALDQAGIQTVGFADPSHSPSVTVAKGGIRIAFLAFAEEDLVWWPFWFREGVGIPLIETSPMVEAVKSAKAEGVDHIVVFLHWGEEGSTQALPSQIELAHQLVDAGAGLILGSHSHTCQGVETYRGAVIAYSLGDCLFGSSASDDCGQLLEVRLEPKGRLEWCKIVGLTMREGLIAATWVRQLEAKNHAQ